MNTFWAWVLEESRRTQVDPAVLKSYDKAFEDGLKRLIQRTSDAQLRKKLEDMLDCPVRTAKGCRGFSEYIHAALIKNGIADQYDVEAALAYVIQKMLMDTSEFGQPRANLFTGFVERPHTAEFNPLQARFMSFLQGAINNIRKGKIPRLLDVEKRPAGTVSIGQGGADEFGVSPEVIPARRSGHYEEIIADVTSLLRRKEQREGLPLTAMFNGIVHGEKTEQLRRKYGEPDARRGREIILGTIEQYAQSTGNNFLLNQVQMMRQHNPNQPLPPRRTLAKSSTPALKPGKEKDYRSIVDVISRFDRPVGSADLGKYRRRWLEYPPRDPSSGFRNRMEEVLAGMVQDGVLTATRTAKGATVYSPGPKADQFRNVEQPV